MSLTQRRLTVSQAALEGVLQQAEGDDLSPLLGTNEVVPGVQGPVPSSPATEIWSYWKESRERPLRL